MGDIRNQVLDQVAIQGKVERLHSEARDHEDARTESMDRSDTDGYVSQWAHSVNASKARAKARLADRGDVDTFPALFDGSGSRVRAKLIEGQYGLCWAFADERGNFTGEFLSAKRTWDKPEDHWTKRQIRGFETRRKNLRKKGYVEGLETAPAKVVLRGGINATPCVVRDDLGFPPDAV